VLTQPFVITVGGANMDVSVTTATALRPNDSTPGEIHCTPGGVARNVSENLARLGVSVGLISVVGDDVFGQRLCEATLHAGVNLAALHTLVGQRTASYMSLHGPGGDMSVAVNDMAILQALTPAVLQPHSDCLQAASVVVLDCNLSDPTLAWLLQKDAKIPAFVDAVSVAKCTRLGPLLPHIHTLKVNRIEAQKLTGLPANSVQEATAAARYLHDQGVANVVVSLGAQGVCWCDASGEVGHWAATPHLSVVNTTGAGDALLAGLVQAHLAGKPLDQAVRWAMACAEITLGSPFANAAELSAQAVQGRLK
jgi:pseudouridine kinase